MQLCLALVVARGESRTCKILERFLLLVALSGRQGSVALLTQLLLQLHKAVVGDVPNRLHVLQS